MILHHSGFPIRKSTDHSLFTAPRSLSQLVTSFVGSRCQGILLMLLFAWTSLKWFSLNEYIISRFLSQIIFRLFILLLISPFVQNVVFTNFSERPLCYFFSSLEDNISLFSIICFVFVLYSVFNEHIRLNVFDMAVCFLKPIYRRRSLPAWWRRWESNPLPLECHSSALPSELRPHWDVSKE